MSTPSEELAVQIVDRLVKEGLLTDDDAKKTRPKLASGEMTAEDWRLYIERAMPTETKT